MNFTIFKEYQREAKCSLPVLIESTKISLDIRQNLNLKTEMLKKADGTKVTICDYIVQTHIVSAILAQFPDDYIMAEEAIGDLRTKEPQFMEIVKSKLLPALNIDEVYSHVHKTIPDNVHRFWAIDPIDGTSGFVKQPSIQNQYAIAISLIVNNDCVFSAVAWPSQIPQLSGLDKEEPIYCFAARNIGSFYTTQSIIEACQSSHNENYFKQVKVQPRPPFKSIMPPIYGQMERIHRDIFNRVFYNKKYYSIKTTAMTKGFTLAFSMGSYYDRIPVSGFENVWDIAPFSMFVEEAGGFATTGDGQKLFFQNDGRVRGVEKGTYFSIRDEAFHKKLVEAASSLLS